MKPEPFLFLGGSKDGKIRMASGNKQAIMYLGAGGLRETYTLRTISCCSSSVSVFAEMSMSPQEVLNHLVATTSKYFAEKVDEALGDTHCRETEEVIEG